MSFLTRRGGALAIAVLVVALLAAACDTAASEEGSEAVLDSVGDCLVVDMAVSPEKFDLLIDLAESFNRMQVYVDGSCVFVNPRIKTSGAAVGALARGWDTHVDGPTPVIWSPASSAWGAILDQRLADQGKAPMAGDGVSFMKTPLVIAMPQPMAEALGWPDDPIGWRDLIDLSTNSAGWAAYGHPEWGPFRLGKTNPNISTSGLLAFIAQSYAGAGKTQDLTVDDLSSSAVTETNRRVEQAVVHYGPTTLTFLNNWHRADEQGRGMQYVSAVAVEEKSVIDYNSGNPDGILDPDEIPRPPNVPLVAIYPEEGAIVSDNPFFILDAPWVSPDQREGALAFQEFVQLPENQRRALEYNFRPGNPDVPLGAPITRANGVDPTQPRTLLPTPEPAVMVELLERWDQTRKEARVLLVIDVSGSMKDQASADGPESKLELATQAAVSSLEQFKSSDQVGLRRFSTGLGPTGDGKWVDRPSIGPISQNQSALRSELSSLVAADGTPLYDVALDSFRAMYEQYDPSRINAIVLLTDGRNDDGNPDDDAQQREALLAELVEKTQGEGRRPVRIFTIGYGADADLSVLREIAQATNGAAYNASDPATIERVFTAVISNF